MSVGTGICVVVAAMDAAGTIGRAVRSALAEPEVAEVIVVDDGSADDTAAAAMQADDGSGRLRVERLAENRGPSAARNLALDRATAPFIAILDSDDMILPGRFARLLAVPDWDLIADNIVFVPDAEFTTPDRLAVPATSGAVTDLDLLGLVAGSKSRFASGRTQLGFLKPVIRRRALLRAGLRYDERLRLGEDFVLYAALLQAGARFRLVNGVGYLAVERGGSLSARHRCEDLEALLAAEQALAARMDGNGPAAQAMARRVHDTRRKWVLRRFLATKRTHGLAAAGVELGARPGDWLGVAEGVSLDKARGLRASVWPPRPRTGVRLLMPDSMFRSA